MPTSKTNLVLRDDTLLGVCQGLGEDFGFNPIYLRVALAALLLWNPPAAVAAYFGLGFLVLVSHLLVRVPRSASAERDARLASRAVAPLEGENDEAHEPLTVAA